MAELAVLVVVMIPVVRVVMEVAEGTHLPWGDYWRMVGTLFNADGSTRPAGFLEFQNEHPVFFAKVFFWLNLRVSDGSNITLGYVVVVLVAVQVLLIQRLLTQSPFSWVERALLLILTSALLFSMDGIWNFTKSMSGAAWLTANLFAVIAIVLRQNDRSWLAALAAAAATVSYGTGLSAWAAVAVVGLVRRPWREWWRELPMFAGAAVGYLWYQSASDGVSAPSPALGRLASSVVLLLEAPLRGDVRAIPVVAVLVVMGLGVVALVRRDHDAAPWLGLAAYGLASNISIAYGRWIFIEDEPFSRYHSLVALFWIGTAGAVMLAIRGVVVQRCRNSTPARLRIGITAAAAALAVPMIGLTWDITDDADVWANAVSRQELAATALALGLGDDLEWATGWKEAVDVEVLRGHGQYPFSGRWDGDCGLLGETLDLDALPEVPLGIVEATAPGALPGGVVLRADVPDLGSIRCVVATAPDGEVVGAGSRDDSARSESAGSSRYVVVALDDRPAYRVVAFSDRHPDGVLSAQGTDAAEIIPT